MAERRSQGSGSLFYDGTLDLWTVRVELPPGPDGVRRRKAVRRRLRPDAEAVLAELTKGLAPTRATQRTRTGRRTETMKAARQLGTHTREEWFAKVRANRLICSYCGRKCNTGNYHKDHVIPVSRGGSDSIDNLTIACQECNYAKSDMLPDEFFAFMYGTGRWVTD